MSKKVRNEYHPRFSIIVNEIVLGEIEHLIKQYFENLSYEIIYKYESKDGAKITFKSLEELKNCDNSLERKIKTLTFEASSDEDIFISIIFGKIIKNGFLSGYSSIHLDVSAIDVMSNLIFEDLQYVLRKNKRNFVYNFISDAGILFTLFLTAIFSFIYCLCFGVPSTYSIPILGIIQKPFDATTFLGNFWKYAQFVALAYVVSNYIQYPIRKIYPKSIFVLGDNKKKWSNKKELIKRIFWNVIVVIGLNLIVAFIQFYFFDNIK